MFAGGPLGLFCFEFIGLWAGFDSDCSAVSVTVASVWQDTPMALVVRQDTPFAGSVWQDTPLVLVSVFLPWRFFLFWSC